MQVVLWVIVFILLIVGFLGTILPALPGAPLVFGGLLLGAWIDNFEYVSWPSLTFIGLLGVGAVVIDFVASALGAKRVGASALALFGAMVGTVVGLFFALPGIIFGPFIGALVGEYLASREMIKAGKVGLGTWLGLMLGTILKLVLMMIMVGLFVLAYFF